MSKTRGEGLGMPFFSRSFINGEGKYGFCEKKSGNIRDLLILSTNGNRSGMGG